MTSTSKMEKIFLWLSITMFSVGKRKSFVTLIESYKNMLVLIFLLIISTPGVVLTCKIFKSPPSCKQSTENYRIWKIISFNQPGTTPEIGSHMETRAAEDTWSGEQFHPLHSLSWVLSLPSPADERNRNSTAFIGLCQNTLHGNCNFQSRKRL